MCHRTSSPIPAKHASQPNASSLEEQLPNPEPLRRLSAPLPSSCGDPEKQRQDRMREEGRQLVIKIRVRIWAWDEVGLSWWGKERLQSYNMNSYKSGDC